MPTKRKLIEVALLLEAINKAAARVVIFAQLVDDPSAPPLLHDCFAEPVMRAEVPQ